jgi:hypothetical protein
MTNDQQDARDYFEEVAAKLEYETGMTRARSEEEAKKRLAEYVAAGQKKWWGWLAGK